MDDNGARNTAAGIIKRAYLRYRVVNSIQMFWKMFAKLDKLIHPDLELTYKNYKYLEELGKHFDLLTTHICNPTVLKITHEILRRVYRYLNMGSVDETMVIAPQISNRVLLAAYLISGFPEFSLSRHRHQLDEPMGQNDTAYDVYQLASDLVFWLQAISEGSNEEETVRQLVTSLIRYSNCHMIWSQQDKLNKMNQYFEAWHNAQLAINEVTNSTKYGEEQQAASIQAIKETQGKLVMQAKKLNPKFEEKMFRLYHKTHTEMSNNMEKAYWDKLTTQLSEGQIEPLFRHIQDAITDIKKLRPGSEPLHEKLQGKLDVFKSKTEFSDKDLVDCIDYVVKIVLLLHSPHRSKQAFELWKPIRDAALNGYLGEWQQYSAKLLEFLFTQLKDLKDDIIGMYTAMSLGINIFEMENETDGTDGGNDGGNGGNGGDGGSDEE